MKNYLIRLNLGPFENRDLTNHTNEKICQVHCLTHPSSEVKVIDTIVYNETQETIQCLFLGFSSWNYDCEIIELRGGEAMEKLFGRINEGFNSYSSEREDLLHTLSTFISAEFTKNDYHLSQLFSRNQEVITANVLAEIEEFSELKTRIEDAKTYLNELEEEKLAMVKETEVELKKLIKKTKEELRKIKDYNLI